MTCPAYLTTCAGTIYEREQLKKGMMAYVMDSLPNLGIVFLVVCALSVLQAAHAVAFSYLPLWFKCDKILAGACAEESTPLCGCPEDKQEELPPSQ